MAMTASKSARGSAAIGRGGAHQLEELRLGVFATGALRHNLLRQDVERRFLVDDGVELAAAHRAERAPRIR